jgi:hypothetical protein
MSPAPNRALYGASGCGVWERHLLVCLGVPKSVGTRPLPVEGDRPVWRAGRRVDVSLESSCL